MRFLFSRPGGFVRMLCRGTALLFTAHAVATHAARAQGPTNAAAPTSAAAEPPGRTVTAAEEARSLYIYPLTGMVGDDGTRLTGSIRDDGEFVQRNEQIDPLIARRAKDWAASLESSPVKGIQLDPMGVLYVAAGREGAAKQQFAARLATPDLSLPDRAYTLVLAIGAFGAKGTDTARMRIALDYMRMLDGLPASTGFEQFSGHQALADAYYLAGNNAAVITQLSKAMSFVPDIPYNRRRFDLGAPGSIGQSFVSFADVLSGQPRGRVVIDSLGKWLMEYAKVPADILAKDTKDSLGFKLGRENTGALTSVIQMTSHFGRPAPMVTANYWWNTTTPTDTSDAAPGARVKSFGDGVIRITEYGHYGCTGCLLALPKLERMRKAAPPGVEMWYVSDGNGGVWGNTPCTPEEEAQHLKHYYLERKQYGMPIALFLGNRRDDPDGGSGQEGSPTFAAYPIQGFPWFVVTDGKGVVRHISFGFDETLLSNALKYLLAEAGHAAPAAH